MKSLKDQELTMSSQVEESGQEVLQTQIAKLAKFISGYVMDVPLKNEDTVHTAIRIICRLQSQVARLNCDAMPTKEAIRSAINIGDVDAASWICVDRCVDGVYERVDVTGTLLFLALHPFDDKWDVINSQLFRVVCGENNRPHMKWHVGASSIEWSPKTKDLVFADRAAALRWLRSGEGS